LGEEDCNSWGELLLKLSICHAQQNMSLTADICCEESKLHENMFGGDTAYFYLFVKRFSFMLQIASTLFVVINIVEGTPA
jgi:hypothetical protein